MEIEFKKDEIDRAKKLFYQEMLPSLSKQELFKAGLRVINNTYENPNMEWIYLKLLDKGLDNYQSILEKPNELEKTLRAHLYRKHKTKNIYDYAKWWPDSKLPDKIIDNVNENLSNEFELRKEIAKEMPGFGLSSSSQLMRVCGYYNVVPAGKSTIEYAINSGFVLDEIFFLRALPLGKYLEIEKFVSDHAKKYDVTPGVLQIAIREWYKDGAGEPPF